MGSYGQGKDELTQYIKQNFPVNSTCLDVGACDGIWHEYLGNFLIMDAVEIFKLNANRIRNLYRKVYNYPIQNFPYKWYDIIIFGDVIEHMTVEDAQQTLEFAHDRCKDLFISVPYLYTQGPIYGNKWEEHIQNDLTRELFIKRYPGYEELFVFNGYAYWHKPQ